MSREGQSGRLSGHMPPAQGVAARVGDVERQRAGQRRPIFGVVDERLVSLPESVRPLLNVVKHISAGAAVAVQEAEKMLARSGGADPHGLNVQEIAARRPRLSVSPTSRPA